MAWRKRFLVAALVVQWAVWVVPVHLLLTGPEPASAEAASHCAAPAPASQTPAPSDPACDLHCSALATAMVAPSAGWTPTPSLTTPARPLAEDLVRASIRATRGCADSVPPAADPGLRTTVLRL